MSNSKQLPSNQAGALAQIVRRLRLVWRLLKDARVPLFPKLIVVAAVLYVLSPIDLIPDFILGLGQFDDVGIIFLSLALFIEFCPDDVVEEHRRAIESGMPAADSAKADAIDGSYRVVAEDDKKE